MLSLPRRRQRYGQCPMDTTTTTLQSWVVGRMVYAIVSRMGVAILPYGVHGVVHSY